MVDMLADVADVVSWARSPVIRGRGGEVLSVPKPELGTDMAQGFVRIAAGLSLLGITDPLPYIVRLARDSIPDGRREVLMAVAGGVRGKAAIAEASGLPERTAARHLEDLQLLRIVGKSGAVVPECAKAISILRATISPPLAEGCITHG